MALVWNPQFHSISSQVNILIPNSFCTFSLAFSVWFSASYSIFFLFFPDNETEGYCVSFFVLLMLAEKCDCSPQSAVGSMGFLQTYLNIEENWG